MLKENTIHLGDCLDLMPSIPSKSVDMILCDLPYGTTACEWDSIIDMGRLWAEYERVIKDNGAIVLTANAKFTFLLGASNIKLLRYKWVWLKTRKTMFLQANKMPLRQHEDVLIFYKSLPTYNPQMQEGKPYTQKRSKKDNTSNQTWNKDLNRTTTINNGQYFPSDLLQIDEDALSIHPTQKPVALFEYLIKTYTNEGELVLDNCSGSGTTAIACMNANRRFICIERDETYHRKSIERISNHEPLFHLGD
jgi:site-specific DNA-methyltransferase (adenine-specific)